MAVLEATFPFSVTAGTGTSERTYAGTLTWTRDEATQVVTMRTEYTRTGVGTGAAYIYFPTGTIPAAMCPEFAQYPYLEPVSFEVRTDGGGYTYVGGPSGDLSFRYVTGAAIVEPEPEPVPVETPTEYEEAFGEWLDQTLSVETFQGAGPRGPVHADPVDVEKCMVKTGNRLVRGSNGEERVSDTTVTTVLGNEGAFLPESFVTLPDGRRRQVFAVAVDAPALPLAHVRVALL